MIPRDWRDILRVEKMRVPNGNGELAAAVAQLLGRSNALKPQPCTDEDLIRS